MNRLTMRVAALLAITTAAVTAAPGAAQARPVRPELETMAGVGQVTLTGDRQDGDHVWFAVAATNAGGRLWYRHLSPEGAVRAAGWADVTCLEVTGNVALLAATVPDGVDGIRNHGFYLKLTDNATRPDDLVFIQTLNGSEPPPAYCVDPDVQVPGWPHYPVQIGGYTVHGD
ncbi:hypothetical protein [Dactylosporangium matsuzakiense]|nr:hypothetical protein [Dactylosporangium matsuzakiense]UWZ47799.1 hypothetical protein Dmats_16180 [Dactylosporangium matsuzakiense]